MSAKLAPEGRAQVNQALARIAVQARNKRRENYDKEFGSSPVLDQKIIDNIPEGTRRPLLGLGTIKTWKGKLWG